MVEVKAIYSVIEKVELAGDFIDLSIRCRVSREGCCEIIKSVDRSGEVGVFFTIP